MDFGMFQGRKIPVTGGEGYFGHKLGNELDEVVNEQMECLQVETWSVNYVIYFGLFYQNNSIRILPLFYAHTKILNFTKNTWKLFQFAVSDTR